MSEITYVEQSGAVLRFKDGVKVGSIWGPAADRSGNWFGYRDDVNGREPVRLESKDAALEFLKREVVAEVPAGGGEAA